jgi:AraC-like DNA-binding protein/mannose-6-phosphate isomerase-like protein (cupin superfamily)
MESGKIIERLAALTPVERCASNYYAQTGKLLPEGQYLYTSLYKVSDCAELFTPKAVSEAERLKWEFHAAYGEKGLTEADFIPTDRRFEIEKVDRYVSIDAHRHEFIELSYVLSGSCTHTIGNTTLTQKEGELTYIAAGSVHKLDADGDSICLTAKLSRELLHSYKLPSPVIFATSFSAPCYEDEFVRSVFLTAYYEQAENTPHRDEIVEGLINLLFPYIVEHYTDQLRLFLPDTQFDLDYIRFLNYMAENYRDVTLTGMAEHFHYNPSYLSNILSTKYGMPFSKILRTYRLSVGERLLRETDHKLNAICDEIGYKDPEQFIRAFKAQYGETPARYRKIRRNEREEKGKKE